MSDLAINGHVAVATQNQAFNALLILYREVLHQPFENVEAVRADWPVRVPVVLTEEEVRKVLAAMSGTPQLMAKLLYGSGLRLLEGLRLRVQDLDFEMRQLTVRDGKGAKDRYTVLAQSLVVPLQQHLAQVQLRHEADLRDGSAIRRDAGRPQAKRPYEAGRWPERNPLSQLPLTTVAKGQWYY